MINPIIMMGNSQENANLTGDPVKADGWFGHVDGLHTVVISVVNFTGRIFIEGTLSVDPEDGEWFPIQLTPGAQFVEFPINPAIPTGEYASGGDTSTVGFSFRVNVVWLRARLDRTYLSPVLYEFDPETLVLLGHVRKITLAR